MKVRFDPSSFEKKWSEKWKEEGIYSVNDKATDKQYILCMFPYPSGAGLHTGHVRIYTGVDILARYFRMKGKKVLYPMGWDAFGLPAENAAIKLQKNPDDLTQEYIENFKRQMRDCGFSFDFDKELSTTDPQYYAITQWLFIQFFNMGLLHKKNTPVYFCPYCKTGIAQEEVQSDGTHERCSTKVELKDMSQWVFRITKYADRLLGSLDGLDWPAGILQQQRNWIGRKEGVEIEFQLSNSEVLREIKIFTTRPDTISAVTYIAVSKDHPLIAEVQVDGDMKTEYVAIHPFSKEEIPIYVADYVLNDYGTGAIMGVPGHNARDLAFAKKFGIPIKKIADTEGDSQSEKEIGKKVTTYHLRDWIFSRQRYWGEPIPMIFCESCKEKKVSHWETNTISNTYSTSTQYIREIQEDMYGWFPSEEKLPIQLPRVESYESNTDGKSPLYDIPVWKETTCPHCGGKATRETDTMPNWAGSCWYFLAFACKHAVGRGRDLLFANYWGVEKEGVDGNWKEVFQDRIKQWLPVDWYIGGGEHAVLHLLYARFWCHALYDLGLIDFKEPFTRLHNVGMLLAEGGRKMSKSVGNVINPDDVIAEYGADTLRIYEMFMAPFNQEVAWSTKSVSGAYRFLQRIWQIYTSSAYITEDTQKEDKKLAFELQKLIIKIDSSIPDVKYNTCISAMMIFLNQWEEKVDGQNRLLHKDSARTFLQILSLFGPFMAEELWREVLGEKESIHMSSWPTAKEVELEGEEITIPIQVDGKVRDVVNATRSEASQENILSKALQSQKIKEWVGDKKYEVKYVQNRILNIIRK